MRDEELEDRIRRIQAGETQEYAYVVGQFQRPLLVYCWRMLGSRHEAEDATQDILVRAFERLDRYRDRDTAGFSAWLYKLAYHHCVNLIRRRNRRIRFGPGLLQPGAADSAAQVVERSLFSEPLSRALAKLTAEERNLLVQRVFEERSFQEIGERTGKSPEAAKKKYARMRVKLQRMLESQNQKGEGLCVRHKEISKTRV